MSGHVVLSLFPGIGILDRGFEEEGFCVVRGPDLLWGQDVRDFHAPAGCFDGVIGGPPCQEFSAMAALVKAQGYKPKHGNLIPEFERVVREAEPRWFVMENVRGAPIPKIEGYEVDPALLNNRWLGDIQNRLHRFSFGYRGQKRRLFFKEEALENPRWEPRVLASSGGARTFRYHSKEDFECRRPRNPRRADAFVRGSRKYFEYGKRLQGLPDEFDLPGFTVREKCRAIGNAVSLPMARCVARAVKRALGIEGSCRASTAQIEAMVPEVANRK